MSNTTIEIDLGVSHWLKSCPECSRRIGALVFKPYPDAFGQSVKRENQEHRGAQPWCFECRRQSWKDSETRNAERKHDQRNPQLPWETTP